MAVFNEWNIPKTTCFFIFLNFYIQFDSLFLHGKASFTVVFLKKKKKYFYQFSVEIS